MKIRNKTGKVVGLGGVTILPDAEETIPAAFETNPIVKMFIASGKFVVLGAEVQPARDALSDLIASLKTAKKPRLITLCKEHGVTYSDDEEVKVIKSRLIEALTRGDEDGNDDDTGVPPDSTGI
jgi:hypothetical protein